MIKIKNIMSKDAFVISPDTKLTDAAHKIVADKIRSLIVVDEHKIVGILSERDIVIGMSYKKSLVKDVLDTDFRTITPETDFKEVSNYLRKENIKRFPVTENDHLVGMVTEVDIIEAERDFTYMHHVTQEVVLGIFGLATAFFLFYFSPLSYLVFG